MNCSKCSDKPTTVGEVLACKPCRDDGTANEIPKDMPADAYLVDAVVRKPGLANRFSVPADVPREDPPAQVRAPAQARSKKPR